MASLFEHIESPMMSYESCKMGVNSLDISGGTEKEARFSENDSSSMTSHESSKLGEKPIAISQLRKNDVEDRIILKLVHKKHEETLEAYDDCNSKKKNSKKCCVFNIFSKCLGKWRLWCNERKFQKISMHQRKINLWIFNESFWNVTWNKKKICFLLN